MLSAAYSLFSPDDLRRGQSSSHAGGSDSEYAADALPALMFGAHPLRGRDPLERHHAWAAADATLASGVVEAALCVVSDRVNPELREHSDNAKEGSAHRGRRVDHRLGETDDVHLAGVEVLQCLDEDALTAGETVESADFEGVPRSEVVEADEPLRPVRDAAGFSVVDEYSFAAGGTQLGLLRIRVLVSL